MHTPKKEVLLLGFFGLVVTIFLGWLSNISPGIEGGMDSYNHYLIAKNTWNHPTLFLDQWGKPLYNLIASPFTQFGIKGSIFLNILCLFACSFIAFFVAREFSTRFAYLAFILTILSPIFLDNTISSLTEPLCALFVIATVYFIIKKKFKIGALIAGFLPFARSEGFIVLGVILVFLLIKKEYRAMLFIFIGSLFFNTLGWIIEGEPFWVITQNPYINFELSGRNVCGSGGLSHYLYAGHYTFGQVVCVLLVISSGIIGWKILKNGIKGELAILLLLTIFTSYFLAHVVIWWLGMMGSCGYERVMTVISPIAAILVVYTINNISKYLEGKFSIYGDKITTIFIIFIIGNAFYVPYRYYNYKYPLNISQEQEQYNQLGEWYEYQSFEDRTKVFLYPYFSIIADIDPYDKSQHLDFWKSSLQFTKIGDILIWDSHFGPNECNTSLMELETNKNWVKIHSIIPSEKITTVNDKAFEIHVFERIQ